MRLHPVHSLFLSFVSSRDFASTHAASRRIVETIGIVEAGLTEEAT
jgi:hypothetical protein